MSTDHLSRISGAALILLSLLFVVFYMSGCGGGDDSNSKINSKDASPMVWVAGDTFNMGSDNGVGGADEQPAHLVTLSGYWIYKYEVTVAQYRAFCTATSRALPPFPQPKTDSGDVSNYSWEGKAGWDNPSLQLHPIVNVTWADAQAYAAWAGVALPTEAQYEYAARGKASNNFPWGGAGTAADLFAGWDQTKCANGLNSKAVNISTWPVGSFPAGASACGAEDLAGNVWEWCADWYGPYTAGAATDPTGAPTEGRRVIRGGSWYESNNFVYRSTARWYSAPANAWPIIGFRCVSVSPEP